MDLMSAFLQGQQGNRDVHKIISFSLISIALRNYEKYIYNYEYFL